MRSPRVPPSPDGFGEASCAYALPASANGITNAAAIDGLDHIGIQFIVMRPQAFVDGIEKCARIFPRSTESAHDAAFEQIVDVITLTHAIDCPIVDGLHHVA